MYRSIIREGIRFASCAVLALALTPALAAQSSCPNGVEIALINGRIHTMDASNGVVSAVRSVAQARYPFSSRRESIAR